MTIEQMLNILEYGVGGAPLTCPGHITRAIAAKLRAAEKLYDFLGYPMGKYAPERLLVNYDGQVLEALMNEYEKAGAKS